MVQSWLSSSRGGAGKGAGGAGGVAGGGHIDTPLKCGTWVTCNLLLLLLIPTLLLILKALAFIDDRETLCKHSH